MKNKLILSIGVVCFFLLIGSFVGKAQSYKIENLPINTESLEFSPYFYKNGIAFIGDGGKSIFKSKGSSKRGRQFDIFFSKKNADHKWQKVEPFKGSINSVFNEGPFSFYKNGKGVVFTRNYSGKYSKQDRAKIKKEMKKVSQLSVFHALIKGDQWLQISPMDFNSPNYSIQHPSISENGKYMVVSSNKEGPYYNLYIVKKVGGKWGGLTKLADGINTKDKHEVFPFVFTDKIMYFASKDRADGMGKMDIYRADNWMEENPTITHLPEPINSSWDDFGYIQDQDNTTGFFSSNRPGGKGSDDIYSFVKQAKLLQGILVDIDKKRIPNSTLKLVNASGDSRGSFSSSNDGEFITEVDPSSDYKIVYTSYTGKDYFLDWPSTDTAKSKEFMIPEKYIEEAGTAIAKTENLKSEDLKNPSTVNDKEEMEEVLMNGKVVMVKKTERTEPIKKEISSVESDPFAAAMQQKRDMEERMRLAQLEKDRKLKKASQIKTSQAFTKTNPTIKNTKNNITANTNSHIQKASTTVPVIALNNSNDSKTVKTNQERQKTIQLNTTINIDGVIFEPIDGVIIDDLKLANNEIPDVVVASTSKSIVFSNTSTLRDEEHAFEKVDTEKKHLYKKDDFKEVVPVFGVIRDENEKPIANSIIYFESNIDSENDTVFADNNGDFKLYLRPDHEYWVRLKKERYFAKRQFIYTANSKDINESISSMAFFAVHMEENVHFPVQNLNYGFNSSKINKEAFGELNNVAEFLLENEDLKCEIASYTDAIGGKEINLILSQKRADAVKTYLMEKGIPASRLIAKGYGESNPVNQCIDNVPCSAALHALNRRTELIVKE